MMATLKADHDKVASLTHIWLRVHKTLQNQDQHQLKLKFLLLWTVFKTTFKYLTTDC